MTKLLTRIQTRLAAIEPAWLAPRRKSIIAPATAAASGAVAELVTRAGIHLSSDLSTLIAGAVATAVAAVVTWAVPNKPAAQP